jgi:predicted lipid-binding transport protein (Tim44 family)
MKILLLLQLVAVCACLPACQNGKFAPTPQQEAAATAAGLAALNTVVNAYATGQKVDAKVAAQAAQAALAAGATARAPPPVVPTP